jgi:hypothetical protein
MPPWTGEVDTLHTSYVDSLKQKAKFSENGMDLNMSDAQERQRRSISGTYSEHCDAAGQNRRELKHENAKKEFTADWVMKGPL